MRRSPRGDACRSCSPRSLRRPAREPCGEAAADQGLRGRPGSPTSRSPRPSRRAPTRGASAGTRRCWPTWTRSRRRMACMRTCDTGGACGARRRWRSRRPATAARRAGVWRPAARHAATRRAPARRPHVPQAARKGRARARQACAAGAAAASPCAVRVLRLPRRAERAPGRQAEEADFDAVAVCNGHYSVPRTPALPGAGAFPGRQMHSHDYRDAAPFAGLAVLVVGASASGEDISREIAEVADTVRAPCDYGITTGLLYRISPTGPP